MVNALSDSERQQTPPEVEIDLSGVTSERDVHEAFARSLHFPDFYGHNWDAFWDVLCCFDVFRGDSPSSAESICGGPCLRHTSSSSRVSRTARGSIPILRRASRGDDIVPMPPQPSNPSLQRTAGRSGASHKIMKTPPLQSMLAPASGR